MKLLIADDELSTRIFLRSCAAKWGYHVVEATDGLEAMTILRNKKPPRIAVLDWMMPGLDGVEICSRLQEQPNEQMTYTILLTCKTDKEDAMHALDRGAHDFLSKPVHVGELHSRIAVGRRLVEANDRLLELDRLKDRFMRIAAHDLRNPLGYIITMSELLTDEDFIEVRREQDKHLLAIHDAASTMQGLINDLLDVSVIKKGSLKLRKQPASIIDLVKRSIRLQQQAAHNKNMRIVECLPDIPDFYFDPDRINQVIDNLLSNAIKFSPPGSTIQLNVKQEKNLIWVAVADQGPGLTEEDRELLFDEFQHLTAKPTGNEKSTGLGLAIAKKIIDVHDGTIQAENLPEGGTLFYFTLPL
ncbi:MAG: response regulator [Candidatus Electrothrix sp. AR4]|nr:response regulator [Candidatus Electrothrix sp. AR4]